ncbi:MAG: sulfur reduction protein DsrE, partial [Chloroflexi bacterium]|nr:sulfur reduction protein DsrE [Chloroflexota bacterium]
MNLLIVLNRTASEGAEGDVAWNALRLAQTSLVKGLGVRLFLMNQGVELAREDQPLWEEIDLAKMLGEILV